MKCQRSFGITTGNPPRTLCLRRQIASGASSALAARSGPVLASLATDNGRPLAKLPTLMNGIRRLLKAYAILWQKLYARFSEHTFDHGNRVLVSRVPTDLEIRDRVSMKTRRLGQFPNRPIQRSTRHPDLCTCHRHETVPLSHVTTSHLMTTMSPNQWGIQ